MVPHLPRPEEGAPLHLARPSVTGAGLSVQRGVNSLCCQSRERSGMGADEDLSRQYLVLLLWLAAALLLRHGETVEPVAHGIVGSRAHRTGQVPVPASTPLGVTPLGEQKFLNPISLINR